MRVLLVRHSISAVDPGSPPSTWGLTDEGRRLAAALDLGGCRLLAGPEPKLTQTLEPHGPVEVDERYAESRSGGWVGDHDEFRATVRRFLDHPDDAPSPGWESAAEVVERFTLVDGAAICSGGRAITAVVSHLTGGDPFERWSALRMPDVLALSRDDSGPWVASTVHEQ